MVSSLRSSRLWQCWPFTGRAEPTFRARSTKYGLRICQASFVACCPSIESCTTTMSLGAFASLVALWMRCSRSTLSWRMFAVLLGPAQKNDEEPAAPRQEQQDQEAPAPVMTLEMLGSFFASVMGDDAPGLPGGATPQRSAPGSPMVTPRSSHSIASTIMYAADEDCIFERYVLLILRCRCS